MAAGVPLIATRSGGIPEICEGTAILVNREDTTQLAEAIRTLYQHPEQRLQLSKTALERSLQFSKERYAEQFFESLTNL